MDELAYRFYDAASKNTNRTRFLDAALVMATLLILGCEIFFVFRPTSRKIRETIALLRESANASKVSEQQQRDLIHHSATPIICLHSESGRIIHANPSAITKLGAVTDSIVGRRFRTYLTSSSLDTYNDHLAILSEIDQTQCHLTIDRGYETREWMANLTSYQTEDNQTHVLINADDITEQKHREQELLEAKQRDGLTGLYTRREFDRRIMELSRDHQLSGMPFALAMIDVDHFKTINESYGHVGGDEVLRRLAQMIQSACRQADMVARYGGEEIAILFPSLASDQAMKVSERIRATLEASVISIDRLEDGSFGEEGPMVIRTTISVGVAAAPTHASDPLRLVQAADEALYEAKQNGRNLVVEHGRTFKRKSDADELIAAVY